MVRPGFVLRPRMESAVSSTDPTLEPHAIEQRLSLYALSGEKLEALARHAGAIEPLISPALDRFYERLMAEEELGRFFQDRETRERLRRANAAYLRGLFTPRIDADYVAGRLRIGAVHHRLRVYPQWYLTSLALLVDELLAHLASVGAEEETITLVSRLFFDASLALDSYGMGIERELRGTTGCPAKEAVSAPSGPGAETPHAAVRSKVKVDVSSATQRSGFLRLGEADLGKLRTLGPLFDAALPSVLAEFYDFFSNHPETSRLVPPETVDRLQGQVASYWGEFVEGRFDRAYAATRVRVGLVHERIGLTPQWYLAGLGRQAAGLIRAIFRDRDDAVGMIRIFFRALLFDVSFVIDAYMESRAETVMRTEGYAGRLVASLMAGVAVMDAEHRVLSVNRSMLDLLGIDPAFLLRMPVTEAVPLPEVRTLLADLDDSPGMRRSSTARWRDRLLRLTAVRLDEGGDAHIALVIDDITELKQFALEMDREAMEVEAFVDAVPDMLWVIELPTWTMLSVSRQALELTGRRDLSFLGRSDAFLGCLEDEDRERFCRHFGSLRDHGVGEMEHRIRHREGHLVPVHTRARRLPQGDGRVLLVGATRDLSAVYAERERRVAAVKQLAGGVAHEINNALTVVMGELQLLDPTGGQARGGQERALLASRRMAHLTSHLLSFAECQILRPKPMDLAPLLDEWKERISDLLGPSIVLDVSADGSACPVKIDRAQLEACLWQVVANSIEAMPGGGSIHLRLKDEEVNGRCVIEIADTGQGMDAEVLAKACEPFFSLRPGRAPGLGLSMVQGFLAQSGGELRIESAPGEGTTVSLRLPRFDADEWKGARRSVPRVVADPLLLIVEDDVLLRNLIVRVASRMDFRIRDVGSAEEARKVAGMEKIDALISDVLLGPGLDGVTLSGVLREQIPGLPVVLCSGHAAEQLDGIKDLELAAFVHKPFSIEELRAALRRLRPEE